jgi:hypothetical protein
MRDHKELNAMWFLYFGMTDEIHPPESVGYFGDCPIVSDNIWSEEQNWVYKKFAVARQNAPRKGFATAPNYIGNTYTYTVSVNSLSPGTRIQSPDSIFYIVNELPEFLQVQLPHINWTERGIGYAAYQQIKNGKVQSKIIGDFANPAAPTNVIDGNDINENWVLFFDSDTYSHYSYQLPVLVSFSHRLKSIECDDDYIIFNFDPDSYDGEITVFLSLPFGSGGVTKTTASSWRGKLPDEVISKCRLINRLVNNWPVDVNEMFKFEDISGQVPRVFVRNAFSYSYMGESWASKGYVSDTPYSLMPPVVALAEQIGVDVTIPSRYMMLEAVDIGFPTKYGPLLMVDLVSTAGYEIPGAPVHDVHLVGTTEETIWKQRVNRMVNLSAFLPGKFYWSVALWGGIGNMGETASLAMTRDWTKYHYLNYMKHTINDRIFNALGSKTTCMGEDDEVGWREMTWDNIPPPPEGSWPAFWTYMYKPKDLSSCGGPSTVWIPNDIDASAGTLLEFLYEYALWSGEWIALSSYWEAGGDVPGIPDIYYPLELFQDWAYMASAHDIWGGAGSEMDMFNAQMAGYDALGKMSAILGYDVEARRARYLAAKAQIPFVMRWACKDFVSQYYKVLDDFTVRQQVISGFGEWEPSGPMRLKKENFTIDNWADWTVSGESIHLLGFDILRTVLDEAVIGYTPFKDALDDFKYNAESAELLTGNPKIGGFIANKLYAFYKYRDLLLLDKTALVNNWINPLCTDFFGSSSAGRIDGPRGEGYYYLLNSPDGWYDGSIGDFGLKSIGDHEKSNFRTFPLIAAIAEAHGVPVRIGAWAPAKLLSASFDPSGGIANDGKLTAVFERTSLTGSLPDAVVRLQVNEQTGPPVVTGSSSGTPSFDPLWKVWEIPLNGYGQWTVELEIAKETGAAWTSVVSDSNLISDPGFEESGYGRPNVELGWSQQDWKADIDIVYNTDDQSHGGDRSACLTVDDDTQTALMSQYLWIGENHNYNIDFWYRIESNDLTLQVSAFEFVDDVGCLDAGGSHIYIFNCPPCVGCDDCTGEWVHFTTTELPFEDRPNTMWGGEAKVKIEVAVRAREEGENKTEFPWVPENEHKVYIDDFSVTCSALDTGNSSGKNSRDPNIVLSSEKKPLLSQVSAHPNPFNPSTVINFKLGQQKRVSLKIYDPAGRLVRTLINEELKAGLHKITWDGRTNKGTPTSSGVYFYKLAVEHKVVTGKLAIIK